MSTDLAAPADAVAASTVPEDAAAPGVDHVTMRLGGGRYGVCAPDVAEVVHVPVVTRLPDSPPWLRGIGNWRGHVLPLVDLRSLLGLAMTPLPSSARVVVVTVDGLEVGLLAEAVSGLAPIAEDCAPPPVAAGSEAAALLRGLADGGAAGPIGVVDTAAVLALAERLPRSRRSAGAG